MTDVLTPSPQNPQARCFALLPCAGTGSRAGTAGPKQYEPLLGVPMVLHTLAAFQRVSRIERVLVVVAPADRFLNLDSHDLDLIRLYCNKVMRMDAGVGSEVVSIKGLDELLARPSVR